MTTTTPDPEQSFEEPRRRVDALEVSPETFDEIAGKLQRLRTEEPLIILGSIGLLRGPSKPVLLAEGDLEAIFARINGWDDSVDGKAPGYWFLLCKKMARGVEFEVLRRIGAGQ